MTIHELLQAAGLTANDEIPIWDVDGTGEPTKKITAQQLAAAVVALANLVTGVKGNAESSYRTGNVNITPANIGAKAVQSAVSDPTASGTAVAFIDSISQNAHGVISPTKKTVQSASQSAAGLMSAADKTKLDGIAAGAAVTSVNNQTGAVSITPANIGAVATGAVIDIPYGGTGATNANDAANVLITSLPTWSGEPTDNTYLIRRNTDGTAQYGQIKFSTVYDYIKNKAAGTWGITISGNATNVTGTVQVDHGGTGATTPALARANLGVNDIGTSQAQSAINLVGDSNTHTITIATDCWVCASFHIAANSDGGVRLWRNNIPVINNPHTNGACNYWANAQFPCRAGGLLQYQLDTNATDSNIYFLTV